MYAQKPYLWSKLIHNSDMYLKKQFIISERRWRTTHNSNTIFKQAEKLKSREMKEGWMKNDKGWLKNDEGWKMKDEGWWFQAVDR